MKLPNADKAVIDIRKITDYCLNDKHPTGKHKAVVFKSAFNINQRDSRIFMAAILKAIKSEEVVESGKDKYGKRYTVDCNFSNFGKEVTIRTHWIIKQNESFPRLITCFVKS